MEYLRWIHGVSRLRLRPSLDQVPIGEGDDDDEYGPDAYDEQTRLGVQPERGPQQNYVVSESSVVKSTHVYAPTLSDSSVRLNKFKGEQIAWLANEAGVVLGRERQDGRLTAFARVTNVLVGTFIQFVRENKLYSFCSISPNLQTVLRTCRRLSLRIGCYNAAVAGLGPRPYVQGRAETSTAGGSTVRRRSPSTSTSGADDDDDDGDDVPDVYSQDVDAPPVTQTQTDEAVSTFSLRRVAQTY